MKSKKERSGRNRGTENRRQVRIRYAVNGQQRFLFDGCNPLHGRSRLQPQYYEGATAGTNAKGRAMVTLLAGVMVNTASHVGYFNRLPGGLSNTHLRIVRTRQKCQCQQINGQNGGCC